MLDSSSLAVTEGVAMSEERFNRIETKLDGVVADVAVLKTDVRSLAERQIDMEQRLTTKMMVLHESTRDSIRLVAEVQHETTRQLGDLTKNVGAVSTQMTQLADANRHFAETERFLKRILDNHEHRITTLEGPQPSR